MVYTIADQETGEALLATYHDGDGTFYAQSYNIGLYVEQAVETTVESASYDVLEEEVFFCDGTNYAYTGAEFQPVDEVTTRYLTDVPVLSNDVMDSGFLYQDQLYVYDPNIGVFYAPAVYDADTQAVAYETVTKYYTITCYLLNDLPYEDCYRTLWRLGSSVQYYQYEMIVATVLGLILGMVLLILLGQSVGRVNGQEEPVLSPLFKIPADLAAAALFVTAVAADALCLSPPDTHSVMAAVAVDLGLLLALVTLGVYLILLLCAQVKNRALVSHSILGRCWCLAKRLLGWCRNNLSRILGYVPLMWKVAVAFCLLCVVEFFGILVTQYEPDNLVILWFLEKILLALLVGYVTLAFRRLKNGAEAIAAGNYDAKVSQAHLLWDFKSSADTLNHIRDGMNAAVESRTRSERLKTELITNVSHDLKTPLTSIVSYVDLLKQEPMGSQAAGEYLEVLDRQSARLKKLIEDLVEASKASTGNISVNLAPLDLGMLLGQALGEYAQRLTDHQLTPVLHVPETPVMIQGDGRLLWRVFDNLLGNVVKYALPGTRVYLTAEAGDTVTATFRNISRNPLEISGEDLMERFVRGDASRHTEGSGLGLSIARSLTQSMGGQFDLQLDGDLFKAIVSFPPLLSGAQGPGDEII
jgi:signal transduction histidine kinase